MTDAPGDTHTVIDFEDAAAGGITPASYIHGSFAGSGARVGELYVSRGLVVGDAALLDGGVGHAPSGTYMIGGVNAAEFVDYTVPVRFTFVAPDDAATLAPVNYFALVTDGAGGSGNALTLRAYRLDGSLLEEVTLIEGAGNDRMEIAAGEPFYSVVVQQTLADPSNGAIGLDDVTFGILQANVASAPAQVPFAPTLILLVGGFWIASIAVRASKLRRH